nr:ribonuclease H-like domain-containing protein [Tanacetum cinerariifolium]
PVRSSLLTRDPLPEVKDAYNVVSREESYKGVHETSAGHPNGTLATISHPGNLKLSNNVILYDVLVVLGYCISLLSVNKLIRDSKMFVGFDENKCYIQDLKKEKILGTDSESGGLYLFDMNKSNCIGGIRQRFWPDCVLTAVYLRNRLSSFVLNGKSPFDTFPQNPNDDGRDSLVEEGSLPHSDGHDT